MRRRRWHRRSRAQYPAVVPSYLRPPIAGNVVFDPTLRRAKQEVLTGD